MKRIIIDIYEETDAIKDLIDIRSETYGFIYGRDKTHNGCQNIFEPDSNNDHRLGFLSNRMADIAYKIHNMHSI